MAHRSCPGCSGDRSSRLVGEDVVGSEAVGLDDGAVARAHAFPVVGVVDDAAALGQMALDPLVRVSAGRSSTPSRSCVADLGPKSPQTQKAQKRRWSAREIHWACTPAWSCAWVTHPVTSTSRLRIRSVMGASRLRLPIWRVELAQLVPSAKPNDSTSLVMTQARHAPRSLVSMNSRALVFSGVVGDPGREAIELEAGVRPVVRLHVDGGAGRVLAGQGAETGAVVGIGNVMPVSSRVGTSAMSRRLLLALVNPTLLANS